MPKPEKAGEERISAVLGSFVNHLDAPKLIIDVGGNGNATVSQPFIDDGWSCLIVEPQSHCVLRLRQELGSNKNVQILQCACSFEKGTATLFHGNDGPGSEVATLNSRSDPWMDKVRSKTEQEEVRVECISALIDDAYPNQEIGILKIDTESWDFNVLRGLDFTRHQPWFIVTEEYLWEINWTIKKHQLLEDSGYVCLGWVDYNTIWAKLEKVGISWSTVMTSKWLRDIGKLPAGALAIPDLDPMPDGKHMSCATANTLAELNCGIAMAHIESAAKGSIFQLQIGITNFGLSPIPALADRNSGGKLFLSYHWVKKSGRDDANVWDGARTPLGRDILPGESRAMDMTVMAPATLGEFDLVLDIVHEGIGWLSSSRAPLGSQCIEVK
jgi:FkbM family methyltransferase